MSIDRLRNRVREQHDRERTRLRAQLHYLRHRLASIDLAVESGGEAEWPHATVAAVGIVAARYDLLRELLALAGDVDAT